MNFFNNISLRAKFIVLVMAFIITFLIYGAYSLYQNNAMLEVTNTIYNHPLEVSNASRKAGLNIIKMHRSMKDVVLAENELQLHDAVRNVDAYEEIVFEELETIRLLILGEQGKQLQKEAYDLVMEWRDIRRDVINLTLEGEVALASEITKGIGADHVQKLEIAFDELNQYAIDKADTFIADARGIADSTAVGLIVLLLLGISVTIIIAVLITLNIISRITILKKGMDFATIGGQYEHIELEGSIELEEIKDSYNALLNRIVNQLWLKDAVKYFVDQFDYSSSLESAISKLSKDISNYTGAENTLIYMLNGYELQYVDGYAVSKERSVKGTYKLGEGLVGQAAMSMEKFRVGLDENIQLVNSTETLAFSDNIIVPITYENEVKGVLEVNSLNKLDDTKIEYIHDVADELGAFLTIYNQNQRVKILLKETQSTNELVRQQSDKLRVANTDLVDKQRELETKQAEILKSISVQESLNEELEERTNEMQNQARELSIKNEELEAIQKQLIENNKQLLDANKYKTDFLTNMSHELRTPLNSIILLSSILSKNENEHISEADLKKVNIINKSGKELLALINDILDLSKIESGKIEVRTAPVNLPEVKNDLEDMFKELSIKKGIDFNIIDELKTPFITDQDKLSHILVNLLSNAFKFTSKGKVELRFTEVKDLVNIQIEDTGIGIPKEKQELVFQEFIQADSGISRKYGGTGLGLAICKNLAELLGGSLSLSSEVGKGTVFTLSLPKDLVNTETEITKKYQVQSELGSILLIEDDYEYAESMIQHLNKRGYSVTHTISGEEGMSIALNESIDGIILDLLLPDVSGEELLHKFKKSERTKNIPIHILTKKKIEKDMIVDEFDSLKMKTSSEEDAESIIGLLDEDANKIYNVLVVEDNEAEQLLIEELLNKHEYNLSIVGSVNEAKELLLENEYDSSIIDLTLDGESGIELCEYIKSNELKLPIILFTAKELNSKEEKELAKLSDSIVLKTVNSRGRLLEELKRFTNRRPVVKNVSIDIDLADKRILVCDDDVKNIFALSAALEPSGVMVFEALNGKEAIDLLETKSVDLILMDIMMPVMDGTEAIQKIKSNEKTKHIPIIAVTAKAMKGDREKFIEIGASDYISKPVDYEILMRLIKVWIR